MRCKRQPGLQLWRERGWKFRRLKENRWERPSFSNCKRTRTIRSPSTWTGCFPVACKCFDDLVSEEIDATEIYCEYRVYKNAWNNHCLNRGKNRERKTERDLNPWIGFDWVRFLKSIEHNLIDGVRFVRLSSIGSEIELTQSSEFDLVRLPNWIELNPWIEFDLVWFSNVRFTMPGI